MFELTGDLDIARLAELDEIAAAVVQLGFSIVDLTEVTFVDSTAINWLLRTKQVVEEKSGRIRVVAPLGMVTRLVSITGLEGIIEVFPTQLEAMGA